VFKAIKIAEAASGDRAAGALVDVDESELPEAVVTVDVAYSSINYKDALAVTGTAPIARSLPMIAGIDLAGTVVATTDGGYHVGDEVVATGSGLSETHWGGLAQKARLNADQLIPLPGAFTSHQAMQIGTAGFTAMLCVLALEDHGLSPDDGPVLVTGAAGGVGSVAIAILAKLGHHVVASTGRAGEADYLRALGAAEVVDRAEVAGARRPLGNARWAGAVDTVGGETLAAICATLRAGAAVAACGNAGGMELPASVAPFILRGIALLGIDSVHAGRDRRMQAWERLATDLDPMALDGITRDIGLSEVLDLSPSVLEGTIRGRLVVDTSR
jgi:acrylyl-CoA reductase (NADPH)